MKNTLLLKFKDSLLSVIPATVVILIFAIIFKIPFFAPSGETNILTFLISGLLLMVGLALFSLGAETSMLTIAEKIGRIMTKKASIIFVVVIGFLIGLLITISEPALWVLASQFPAIPANKVANLFLLLIVIGVGVGIFLVLALLRIAFQVKLRTILIASYAFIFLAVFLVPLIPGMENFKEFVPFAFDSSGVTTGPMAVPFIMSLGLGFSSSQNDKEADSDSFGLVGIASIGPIIASILLGIVIIGQNPDFKLVWDFSPDTTSMGNYFLTYLWQMAIAIAPFIIFFIFFQIKYFKLTKKQVIKVLIGFLFTYVGLVLFLSGANAGYLPMGKTLGGELAKTDFKWILIPVGMLFGAIVIAAEPSVIVLNKQVDDMTSGAINKKVMLFIMSIGMALSIGIAMTRIVFNINSLWFLVPGYIIIAVLSFFSPKKFTGIAIDSGGAVSGAMTSTFLVGFSLGAAEVMHPGDSSFIFMNAFGLVAMVAMIPLITIQILGIIYKRKQQKATPLIVEDEIVVLED